MKAPEAYPLGYVEDAFEVRTTLVDFFNSRPGAAMTVDKFKILLTRL
jgi:hypothetical protein